MTYFGERLVIKANFTSDDVDFVSMQRGWILKQAQKHEAGAYIDSWVTLDRETEIHQIDDRPIATRYFTLRGPGSAEVARHIREDCELWSAPEALKALNEASARGEKLALVYAVALAATEEHGERVTRAFQNIACDPDATVRQSVIVAAGYFPYPGLVDLVRQLRDGDPVDHVRKNAEILLNGLYG
ncbi:MAG TPA: HEAT repeat domain-containing protein [Nonomuraea sp.]|nr:HEAT repeat domain-containing protein [Nonomuraea sp.]